MNKLDAGDIEWKFCQSMALSTYHHSVYRDEKYKNMKDQSFWVLVKYVAESPHYYTGYLIDDKPTISASFENAALFQNKTTAYYVKRSLLRAGLSAEGFVIEEHGLV